MTAQEIRKAIRHWFAVINKRDQAEILAICDETLTSNVVTHNPMGTDTKGIEAVKKGVNVTAFPDAHYTIEDIIVEGDKAFMRVTWTGTHKGKLPSATGATNLATTGKKVTMTQFVVWRYEGGKVAEQWVMTNRLSFYQQLGLTPSSDMR